MSQEDRHPSHLADIQYADYLLLMCSADAEWSRRRPTERFQVVPPPWNHVQFREKCLAYGKQLDANHKAFIKANSESSDPCTEEQRKPLDNYLFNPLSYYPLSHADDTCLVLADDHDVPQRLVAEMSRKLEDVSIAYCPLPNSFVGDDSHGLFVPLHAMFDPELGLGGAVSSGKVQEVPVHGLQREMPLLMFTRYKMEGLVALGQALVCQEAVYKAMAERVTAVVAHMKRHQGRPYVDPAQDLANGNLRVCFLDMQRSEEIGTLIFTRNFSVATSIVGALRGLTFEQMFAASQRAGDAYASTKSLQEIIKASKGGLRRSKVDPRKTLAKNHLFRWTSSTLMVAPQTVLAGNFTNCHGLVEAATAFQTAPGHDTRTFRRLSRIACGDVHSRRRPRSSDIRFTVGTADLIMRSGPQATKTVPGSFVDLRTYLAQLRCVYDKFGRRNKKADAGRDVVDLTPLVSVPVPSAYRSVLGNVARTHFSPLSELLPQVQSDLSPPQTSSKDHEVTGGADEYIPLHMPSLSRSVRSAGLPVALRRAVESLYQTYFTLLADPFLFDAVLDLHDVFASLHRTLVHDLPAVQTSAYGTKGSHTRLLDDSRAEQLGRLIEAIQNALSHRLAKEFPDCGARDMSVYFRGGLNQAIMAATAPVTCALGLFRRFGLRYLRGGSDRERDMLGGVVSVSLQPDIKCCALDLAVRDSLHPRLVFFEADVPHILHVACYSDYIHEAGHLMFDAICRARLPDVDNRSLVDKNTRAHLTEVFANWTTQVFVFERHREAAIIHHAATYARSLSSVGVDDIDAISRLSDVLLRLFYVYDSVPHGDAYPGSISNWMAMEWDQIPRPEGSEKDRFAAMVRTVAPYLPNFTKLVGNDEGSAEWAYLMDNFTDFGGRMSRFLPGLWREFGAICREFIGNAIVPKESSSMPPDAVLREEFCRSLEEGRPFLSCLCREESATALDASVKHGAAYVGEPDDTLDPLYLVGAMLGEYIRTIEASKGRRMCLEREDDVGWPKFTADTKTRLPLNEFLLDLGCGSMFCPVPTSRRRRLRKQIALFKTLWDVSSILRARRLWRLINDGRMARSK